MPYLYLKGNMMLCHALNVFFLVVLGCFRPSKIAIQGIFLGVLEGQDKVGGFMM